MPKADALRETNPVPTFRRLLFRCEQYPDSDLVVDVLMDERRHWVSRVPTGGWWGGLRSGSVWPFILTSENGLDFGCDTDEETGESTIHSDRYGAFDIADRILAVGEKFTLDYGSTYYLKLERVTDILSL